MGVTVYVIQLPLTGSLQCHVGIMGTIIQDEIWVGAQPNHINKQEMTLEFKDWSPEWFVSTTLDSMDGSTCKPWVSHLPNEDAKK